MIIISAIIMAAVIFLLTGILMEKLPLILAVMVIVAAAGIVYVLLVLILGVVKIEDIRELLSKRLKKKESEKK